MTSSNTTTAAATTRLHITPLTPTLLNLILPAPIRESAYTIISYHALETFPEKAYGFVTLPAVEAQRVKQRINGTYIKGMKVRVEDAREEKRVKRARRDEQEPDTEGGRKTRERRSARTVKDTGGEEQGVLQGRQLSEGKHVKRGWETNGTGSGKRSSSKSSKHKGDEAAVVRTAIPENAPAGDSVKGKRRKTKDGKGKRVADIKEFSNTVKTPSFVQMSTKTETSHAPAARFKRSKGWVDDDGNVVEEVKGGAKEQGGSSSEDDGSEEEDPSEVPPESDEAVTADIEKPATNPTPPIKPEPTSTLESLFKRPTRASTKTTNAPTSAPSLNVPEQSQTTTSTPFSFFPTTTTTSPTTTAPYPSTEAHPTEAHATTKPTSDSNPTTETETKPRQNKRKTSTLSLQVPPSTPYTALRERDRALRSAAPTPDTAAIGARGRFRAPWRSVSRDFEGEDGERTPVPEAAGREGEGEGADEEEDADEDEDVDMDDTPLSAPAPTDTNGNGTSSGGNAEKTEFEKEFYAQRGELNRAWKARRRAVRKEVRQDALRRGRR